MIYDEETDSVTDRNEEFVIVRHNKNGQRFFSIHHGEEEVIVVRTLFALKKVLDFAASQFDDKVLESEDLVTINPYSYVDEEVVTNWDELFPG